MPTVESYQKAVELVQSAVKLDSEKRFLEAFNKYCQSLRYFVPIINGKLLFHLFQIHSNLQTYYFCSWFLCYVGSGRKLKAVVGSKALNEFTTQ